MSDTDDRSPALDPDAFLAGFTEEDRQVPVPADSPLGRAMAEYRERRARGEVEELDLATFRVDPRPVTLG